MNKWLCIKKNIHVMEYCRYEDARRERERQREREREGSKGMTGLIRQ
jgi:hypothetical protein